MNWKNITLGGALAVAFALPLGAQSLDELVGDKATPGDVLTYGMGYDQQRHSPLDQINTDNVHKLIPAWTYSLNDDRGQESFPLVYEGRIYVTTHKSTMAVDALTGRQIWKTAVEYPAETPRAACCGIVNRGAAIYDGKIFRTTLDAFVIALDAETGQELWRAKSQEFKNGYSMTVAPLIADGVLITGVSGGEYGIRGYIEGYDPQTGERLWRTHTIPAPGEPGSETWQDDAQDAWQHGGGPTWLTGSYDPELNLVYWGVGNAASWNAGVRPGDNLYTGSVIAVNPQDGAIQWHYQYSPNDPFDHDGVNEFILAEIDGRKIGMSASRNGFFYVIDRATGELLAANQFADKLNWAERVDLATGRPVHTEIYHKAVAGEEVTYWPGGYGAKNWGPMAYSPETGLAYANVANVAWKYKAYEPQFRAGIFYLGAEFAFVWPEGDRGALRAIDPSTGKAKWSNPIAIPRNAGVLSTAGGVIFTGSQTGEFEAFDAETGTPLWSYQTGSGIVGQPVTWELDGTQYVTIVNGGGAGYVLFAGDERLAQIPPGGALWTFKLAE